MLVQAHWGLANARDWSRPRFSDGASHTVKTDGEAMEQAVGALGQVAITVSSVEAATQYYRDVLGLRFLFSAGPDLAFLSAGLVRIMLSTPQGSGAVAANSILYFTVQDIEVTHAAIVRRGSASERAPELAARMPDHELWLSFLRDPDGNLIGLMEEKR